MMKLWKIIILVIFAFCPILCQTFYPFDYFSARNQKLLSEFTQVDKTEIITPTINGEYTWSKTIFKLCTNTKYGGAISFTGSNTVQLTQLTDCFFISCTGSMYGGCIYFQGVVNSFILKSICFYNSSLTGNTQEGVILYNALPKDNFEMTFNTIASISKSSGSLIASTKSYQPTFTLNNHNVTHIYILKQNGVHGIVFTTNNSRAANCNMNNCSTTALIRSKMGFANSLSFISKINVINTESMTSLFHCSHGVIHIDNAVFSLIDSVSLVNCDTVSGGVTLTQCFCNIPIAAQGYLEIGTLDVANPVKTLEIDFLLGCPEWNPGPPPIPPSKCFSADPRSFPYHQKMFIMVFFGSLYIPLYIGYH